MTPVTPLTHALLYLKNAKTRIKYPKFAGFALESASPRAPNTCVTPTKIFLDVKQAWRAQPKVVKILSTLSHTK